MKNVYIFNIVTNLVKHPKITVDYFGEEYGNGIKATEDINRDDLLIEAPMKRVLYFDII